MSLDDMILDSRLLADLYKKSLVSDFSETTKDSANKSNKTAFLGENAKNILILVNEPDSKYLGDENLSLLTNILKACDLSLADVGIVNVHNQTVDNKLLGTEFNPSLSLFFGVNPAAIGYPFEIPHNHLYAQAGKYFYVAKDLTTLQDTTEKKFFWVGIRTHFGK